VPRKVLDCQIVGHSAVKGTKKIEPVIEVSPIKGTEAVKCYLKPLENDR
jgi:hypothetical protein